LEEKKKNLKLEIHLDEDLAQGAYVNLAMVNHNETEFVVDFIFVQPQVAKGKVRSRVILSPQHAKRFVAALQENIDNYEKNVGAIVLASQQKDETLGHYH
jgi:hypothetical protein